MALSPGGVVLQVWSLDQAAASPRKLSEMQVLKPHFRPIESETGGSGGRGAGQSLGSCVWTSPPKWLWYTLKCESYWFRESDNVTGEIWDTRVKCLEESMASLVTFCECRKTGRKSRQLYFCNTKDNSSSKNPCSQMDFKIQIFFFF